MVTQTQTLQHYDSQSHIDPKHRYYNTTALRVINIYKLGYLRIFLFVKKSNVATTI